MATNTFDIIKCNRIELPDSDPVEVVIEWDTFNDRLVIDVLNQGAIIRASNGATIEGTAGGIEVKASAGVTTRADGPVETFAPSVLLETNASPNTIDINSHDSRFDVQGTLDIISENLIDIHANETGEINLSAPKVATDVSVFNTGGSNGEIVLRTTSEHWASMTKEEANWTFPRMKNSASESFIVDTWNVEFNGNNSMRLESPAIDLAVGSNTASFSGDTVSASFPRFEWLASEWILFESPLIYLHAATPGSITETTLLDQDTGQISLDANDWILGDAGIDIRANAGADIRANAGAQIIENAGTRIRMDSQDRIEEHADNVFRADCGGIGRTWMPDQVHVWWPHDGSSDPPAPPEHPDEASTSWDVYDYSPHSDTGFDGVGQTELENEEDEPRVE